MKKYFVMMFVFFVAIPLQAEEIKFTILSTGDLHSRFEPHVAPSHLGGMARLKTAMDQIEATSNEANRPVLRLDAGDCTEGGILFNLGAGVASYELLNMLGFDAITVGNHDWYLGPDSFNGVLERSPRNFSFLAANLNWRNVDEHPLREKLKAYEVFYLVNGQFIRRGAQRDGSNFEPEEGVDYFKIGVFGLVTNEALYSFFFDPVMITNPLAQARRTVLSLRRDEKADVIIALTHMKDEDDLRIAQRVTSVDLIIGGHSHNRVIPVDGKPIVVSRDESGERQAWIIKNGEYGQFMGQVDLTYDTTREKMVWNESEYSLHQIDARYRQDEAILAKINEFRVELEEKYEDRIDGTVSIFSDNVARTEIDLNKTMSTESYLGNLVTNALLEAGRDQGAHFSVNTTAFLTHSLYRGPLHSASIYDALPHIYDPVQDRAWTVWLIEITGGDLKKAIDLVYIAGLFFDIAGAEIVYDPNHFPDKVMSVTYQGEELEDDQVYTVAASRGIVDALNKMKDEFSHGMSIVNTGIEIWDALQTYMVAQSPIRANNDAIRVSGRIRTVQPDLVVLSEDIVVVPVVEEEGKKLQVTVVIKNLGYGQLLDTEIPRSKTDPIELTFYYDNTPGNFVDDVEVFKADAELFAREYHRWNPSLGDDELPKNVVEIDKVLVRSLQKDEQETVELIWDVSELPVSRYPYQLYVKLGRASGTGFVDEPAEEVGAAPTRKMVRVHETNIDNNKAMAFIDLNDLFPQEEDH